MIEKRSTKLEPLSINLPKLKNLLVNIHLNVNTATEVKLGLPYILQTVRPWSSGARFYSPDAIYYLRVLLSRIYIRKPKVLETILRKNRKVVPRVDESKEVNKESPIRNKEICKKYSLISERR